MHKTHGVNESVWSVSSRKLLHILFVKHFLHFKVQFSIQTMFWSQSFSSALTLISQRMKRIIEANVHCLMNKDTDGY